jgi:hypothetical protein
MMCTIRTVALPRPPKKDDAKLLGHRPWGDIGKLAPNKRDQGARSTNSLSLKYSVQQQRTMVAISPDVLLPSIDMSALVSHQVRL